MPPKRKKTAAKNKHEAPPAKTIKGEKKIKSEKTPTVSPDSGATGGTAMLCRLIQVSLGVYRVLYMFFWPAEFPGYHQWQQESQ